MSREVNGKREIKYKNLKRGKDNTIVNEEWVDYSNTKCMPKEIYEITMEEQKREETSIFWWTSKCGVTS